MTTDQLERGMQLYDAINDNESLLDLLDKCSVDLSDSGLYIGDEKFHLPDEIMKNFIVIAATYYSGVKDKFIQEFSEL